MHANLNFPQDKKCFLMFHDDKLQLFIDILIDLACVTYLVYVTKMHIESLVAPTTTSSLQSVSYNATAGC